MQWKKVMSKLRHGQCMGVVWMCDYEGLPPINLWVMVPAYKYYV
jgi:hypothetical protein